MAVPLAALFLLLALPGLCRRRHGRLVPRAMALVAMLVLFAGVWNPQRDIATERPGRVVALATAPMAADDVAALRGAVGEDAEVVVVEGDDALDRRAAGAWLAQAGSGRAVTLAVLWTGPFEPEATPEPVAADAVALSATPPPPLEPGACAARAILRFEAGRPAAVEVQVEGGHPGLTGRVAVVAPTGRTLHEQDLDAAELAAGRPVEVRFEPEDPGRHELRLELLLDGTRVEGRGSFEVAEPAHVHVVGRAAAHLAAALEVQGLAVQESPALPDDLSQVAVLVLLDPLDADGQRAVAQFVDGGGGVFLVGAEEGGALPAPGEPLDPLLPVSSPPRRSPGGGEKTGDEGGAPPPDPVIPEPEEPEPEKPEPEKPESPPPETPPPPKAQEAPPEAPPDARPDAPAQGETGGDAKILEGPEQEVDRRTVAMVLVVDRSGSMGLSAAREMVAKIEYAKRAAVATAEALLEGDRVAVVTFGTNGQVVLPLTSATMHESIRDKLSGIRATDGTTLLADALMKAQGLLVDSGAAVRHIVVISDGEIHDELPALRAARDARQLRSTVSLIQIGGGRALVGSKLATLGGGRFVTALDASEIPRLVSLELRTELGKVGRKPGGEGPGDGGQETPPTPEPEPEPQPETPPPEPDPPPPEPEPEPEPAPPPPPEPEEATLLTVHAVSDSPLLEPDTEGAFPPVGGILPVEARTDGQVLLLARRGDDGVPLLAFSNRGLGKVGVWTSDLLGAWGGPWRGDADFPPRLAQWVSSLRPAAPEIAARDLLERTTLDPSAPVAPERAALESLTGRPLQPLDEFAAPATRTHVEQRGLARELALAGLLALALLAAIEYLVGRMGAARPVSRAPATPR